ncbi:SDR family oxidoreductase [Amycolatopsis sp. MJM2582]|uniref:SDR family oxidoreductase n=1 Tax=Amycolatopsis sp. MJM2582 TaxID=1427749 RepID=UPI00190F7D9D|nr:SDR family oxidoreductase [Amycolatopsis sp. MJM2582]
MIVNYRTDSDGAIGVVDDIEAAGGTASSARADVTDPEAADALVTGILSLRGWIVYIGSTAPDYVGEGLLAHGTAESALTTFARHVAAESGRDGVSVLVVVPGAVRTPATAGILAGVRGEVLARESVLGRNPRTRGRRRRGGAGRRSSAPPGHRDSAPRRRRLVRPRLRTGELGRPWRCQAAEIARRNPSGLRLGSRRGKEVRYLTAIWKSPANSVSAAWSLPGRLRTDDKIPALRDTDVTARRR